MIAKFLLTALFVLPLPAATVAVTIAGLGGEPDYDQRFNAWANEMDKTLKGAGSEIQSEVLTGAAASKAGFRASLTRAAEKLQPNDALIVFLIGHGTFDGVEYKFNLPGADLSAAEIAAALDKVPASRQLVVNMTSSSGASAEPLRRKNRTVITATKSGTEKNAPVFARYWAEALRDSAADTDKNEAITALEAFQYAQSKTKAFYETNKRLATEHALLENGEPGGPAQAGRFALLRMGSLQKATNDPAKRALFDKREKLEAEIDQLKYAKASIPTDQYKAQLTRL